MTLSFFPISKNKLTIPANGFIEIEFMTPADKAYYLKTMFCNQREITVEFKDDTSSYTNGGLNVNFFNDQEESDFKIVYGTATRIRVTLQNLTDVVKENISFSLIGYKLVSP